MTDVNAKFRFVQQARALPTYGMTTFEAQTKEGSKVKKTVVGITREGVYQIDPATNKVN